jgi:hypothetical protein
MTYLSGDIIFDFLSAIEYLTGEEPSSPLLAVCAFLRLAFVRLCPYLSC